MTEHMNRRQRIRRRIFWHGDRWCDRVLEWQEKQPKGWRTSDRLLEVLTPHDREGWASRALCRLLAHYAIEDHCGKPEHDNCLFCGMGIPDGAAAERAERFRRVAERKGSSHD